jgi:hypothetical protein
MSKPSGFVPVPFQKLGRVLIVVGAAGLLMLGVSQLLPWLSLPTGSLFMGLALIVIGAYLILFVPRQDPD